MSEIRRIYIAGGAGVGKTTLMKLLAKSTGSPTFELDELLWAKTGSDDEEFSDAKRQEIVHEIAVRPAWISEGVYVGRAQELWHEADLVIYIRSNLRSMLWRRFLRHVKAELRRNNRHPGWLNLFRIMRTVARQYRRTETGDIDNYQDDNLSEAKIQAKANQQRHKVLKIYVNPNIEQILAVIADK